jgi:hypothetical protein
MDKTTLSPESSSVLKDLRENVESESEAGWGAVYLDNARSHDMSRHVWAGLLSALEGAGFYRPAEHDHRGYWGYVKLAD